MSEALSKIFDFSNPMFAFIVVAIVYYIGEFIGTRSKAWIPSVFVTSAIFLVGYWYIFPKNMIDISGLGAPLGGLLAIMILITHMGTVINIKQLKSQWKIICVTLAGLAGMVGFCMLLVFIPYVGKINTYAGIPPLTGGVVAATLMKDAAASVYQLKMTSDATGATPFNVAATLAIALYAIQGFFGYPLTAIALKKEGNILLDRFRSGKITQEEKEEIENSKKAMVVSDSDEKTLIPKAPAKYMTTAFILGKLMIVALLAVIISTALALLSKKLNAPIIKSLSNAAVVTLILGIIFTELGFLDKNSLVKAKSDGFFMMILMLFVFSGYKNTTPETLKAAIGPMLIIIIVGIIGMAIFSIIVGKFVGVNWRMALATSLTALYGFPPNYILTEEAAKSLAKNAEEKEFLMSKMLPQMIVGGFITVTITSVVIAGIFAEALKTL